jgi:hypothetical protein
LLKEARNNSGWQDVISFKDVGKRQGFRSPRTRLVHSWLTIGLAALQQQKFKELPVPFSLSGTPPIYKTCLDTPIGCKFVVFKERDSHKKMFCDLSTLCCIETTFRMGLKGGAHRLFSESNPVKIGNVFIDGDEQYIGLFGRTFDVDRTLSKFIQESRDYVGFIDGAKLIPQKSDHSSIKEGQNPEESQFLQLCDILLGGVRHHCQNCDGQTIRHRISLPCRELVKRDDGVYFNQNSRFLNGFSLREAWIGEDNCWDFAPLKIKENAVKAKQLVLNI